MAQALGILAWIGGALGCFACGLLVCSRCCELQHRRKRRCRPIALPPDDHGVEAKAFIAAIALRAGQR